MVSGLVIVAISVALFCIWFLYYCGLIIRSKIEPHYAAHIAELNDLKFLDIQQILREPLPASRLAPAYSQLTHDFEILSYLLFHASEYEAILRDALEFRMLIVYYQALAIAFPIARLLDLVGLASSIRLLREMADVVMYLASNMGERFAVSSEI